MKTSPTLFRGFTIYPILNDDDQNVVDYYDVHEIGDEHGEGEPLAMFGTKQEAQVFVSDIIRSRQYLKAIESAFFKF